MPAFFPDTENPRAPLRALRDDMAALDRRLDSRFTAIFKLLRVMGARFNVDEELMAKLADPAHPALSAAPGPSVNGLSGPGEGRL